MTFLSLTFVAMWMVYPPLRDLLTSPTHTDYYSHIMLIPLVSGLLIYSGRKTIFTDPRYSCAMGAPILLIGSLIYLIGWYRGHQLNQNDYSALLTFSGILFWIGDFILFYGMQAFRTTVFPVLFLAFMIPIPSLLMDRIIYLLLVGSNEVTYMLFGVIGIPFLQDGFTFHLPGVSIEVAKECSGIRSSLGLFITSILAGHLFLRRGWEKFILAIFVFPVAVLKNGIRIVTLSLLAIYVDEKFLTHSFLHHSGAKSRNRK